MICDYVHQLFLFPKTFTYFQPICIDCNEMIWRKDDLNLILNMGINKYRVFFFFLRERLSTSGEGAESERETQNPKQASGSDLSAQSRHGALSYELWDRDLSQSWMLNRQPPRSPDNSYFLSKVLFLIMVSRNNIF